MSEKETMEKVERVEKEETVAEPRERKQFVSPELKRHPSLPRVTSGFASSFIP